MTQLGPETLRTVDLTAMGEKRFKATNVRGGVLPIGQGDDPDFTPVELLLAALAGCGAIDLEWVTDKRAPFASFAARAQGNKVRDEHGSHLVNLSVTLDVSFPDGEEGDQAREVVPRTLKQIEDRLCTVARTVALGEPVSYEEGVVVPRAEHGLEDRADPAASVGSLPDLMAQVRPWREVPSQEGRRFVVTGASSGIGLETAKALAAAGAQVVLGVRNLDKGKAAADQMPGDVEVALLDVADLSSVRTFADGVGPVDVLVNNAGVLGVPFGLSPDGVELHLATNHLGHFALANLLLPRLTDRVVVVGSASHRSGELDLDDLLWERRRYAAFAAYGASKLANLLFLAELQRRLTAAGSTLRVTGAHPGTTSTHITSGSASWPKRMVGKYGHRLIGMPAWQGALPTLYAATMDVPGNTYLGPHRLHEMIGWPTPVGRSDKALDPDLAKALWTESERLSGVTCPL